MQVANPEGATELNDVDSVAARLQERYSQHEEPASNPEDDDETPEIEGVDETPDEEDETPEPDQEVSDEQEPEADDEAPQFQTVDELAEALDMSVDDFLSNIKGKVKIDGEETEITLAEMRDGQQRESDYRRKTMQLSDERKAFEEQQSQANAKFEQELQKVGAAFNIAQQQITHEFQSIDWNKLRSDNPAEFAIKQQEFGQRQALLNQQIETATQQAQAFKDQQKAEADEARSTRIQEEQQKLLTAIPEWKDEKVSSKEYPEVLSYWSDLGYSAEEINEITDHRRYVEARDAMAAKSVKSSVDLAKNKIKKAPKLVKPNARQNVNQGKANKVSQLTKRFKKTGSTDDLQAVLLARRS